MKRFIQALAVGLFVGGVLLLSGADEYPLQALFALPALGVACFLFNALDHAAAQRRAAQRRRSIGADTPASPSAAA